MMTNDCKRISEQNAAVYITYMIGASYFNIKPECASQVMEERLRLYYVELKTKKQILVEELCDKYMNKVLSSIPTEMWDMRSVVEFKYRRTKEGIIFDIVFDCWKYKFTFSVSYDERGRIKYSHILQKYVK